MLWLRFGLGYTRTRFYWSAAHGLYTCMHSRCQWTTNKTTG